MRISAVVVAAMAAAFAQPVRTGQMLIATNASHDPDFARTVVLIVHSDAHGVAGLFLNRPTDADILRVLPKLGRALAGDKTVYAGGPLAIGINALVRSRTRPENGDRIGGDIWVIAEPDAITRAVSRDPRWVRVYIGQCGWSREQIQGEMARRLWSVSLADAELVFDKHSETLWKRLSARVTR